VANAIARLADATLKTQDGARTVLTGSRAVQESLKDLNSAVDQFVEAVAG